MANVAVNEDSRRYGVIYYNLVTNVGGNISRSVLYDEVSKTKEATLFEYLTRRKKSIEEYRKGNKRSSKPKILYDDQFHTLFPEDTAAINADTFDISLLMFLFNNFIFNTKGKQTTDKAVLENLRKILLYRNKIIMNYDKAIKKTLLKQSIPNLLHNSRKSVSHAAVHEIVHTEFSMEKETFEAYVKDLRTVFTSLAQSYNLSDIEKSVVEELEAEFVSLDKQIKTDLEKMKQDDILAKTILEAFQTATNQKSYNDVKDILPDAFFVKTKQYEEAKKSLIEERIIILNGSPGEGKTTVAKKLLKEVSKVRRIEVNSVNELTNIGNDVDAVLIDDMFGASVFDKYKYRKWQNKLHLISQWVNQTEIEKRYVVITSRTYILEKAKDQLLFSKHKICSLSSDSLEPEEKKLIILNHFQIKGKTPPNDSILDKICILKVETKEPASPFIIGFPECARIFSFSFSGITFNEVKVMKFFKAPMENVINHISELCKDDDTFVAFFLLWTGNVNSKDIERPLNDTPDTILTPIKSLQYSPKTCLRKIRGVLYHHAHKGGLISEDTSENYTFSHRVVCDAVGLIAFTKNPTAALAHFDKDFIERYISFHTEKDTKIGIRLKKSRYDQLSSRILDLVIPDRDIIPDNYSLFKCSIFKNEEFCSEFLKADKSKLQILLKSSVRSVGVIFKPFKFNFLENVVKEVKLTSFLLWHKGKVTIFAEKCLKEMHDANEKLKELSTALYIASAVGLIEIAEFATKQGGKINSEMILIAFKSLIIAQHSKEKEEKETEKEKERVLNHLKSTSSESKDCFPDSKGCYPIHLAAIEGYLDFVKESLHKSRQDAYIPYSGDFLHPKLNQLISLRNASLYHIALCVGEDMLIHELIKQKVSTHQVDGEGRSPFLYAIEIGRIKVVKALHEKAKDDGNEMLPDAKENTPLHLAIIKCESTDFASKKIFKDVAIDLCKMSDYIHLQNSDGKSPFHLACMKKQNDVIKKLLDINGFNLGEKNMDELIKTYKIDATSHLQIIQPESESPEQISEPRKPTPEAQKHISETSQPKSETPQP